MGQQRTDTANQRAAKQRVADRRRCPACSRRSALSTAHTMYEPRGRAQIEQRVGHVRTCLYCGHEVGVRDGKVFGRSPVSEVA